MSEVLKKDFIYDQLRHTIQLEMKSGDRLPGELQLAKTYNVSRVTLRSALQKLEQDKLIIKVNGKGTFVAKNLLGTRFLAIGAATSDITSPMQYILPGIKKRLAEADIELEQCPIHFFRSIDFQKAKKLFESHSIRGIFLLDNFYNGNEPELNILKASGLPVVLPHAKPNDRNVMDFAMMLSDDRLAFGDGVRELIRYGHRCIGTIFAKEILEKKKQCRGFSLEEYMEFLKLNGAAALPCLIKAAEYTREGIFTAVRDLMLGPAPPTAIMCFSDFYAIQVYEALKKLRIRIPEQVAVMGFCGYPGGQFMSPPLSTVDLGYENIGRMAAGLMLESDEWQKENSPVTVYTPHHIVILESIKHQKEELLITF